jgi:hypothetical protein
MRQSLLSDAGNVNNASIDLTQTTVHAPSVMARTMLQTCLASLPTVINTDIATKYSVQSLELSIKLHALSSSFEKLNRIDYMPRPL